VATIVGSEFARSLGEYLPRTGVESELTDETTAPRAGNLFSPVDGDAGARGRFADGSHASRQVTLGGGNRQIGAVLNAPDAYVTQRPAGYLSQGDRS